MNCKKCGNKLFLKTVIFKNDTTHLRSWCSNCRKLLYHKRNKQNLEFFKDSKLINSKPRNDKFNLERVEEQELFIVGDKLKPFKKRFGSKYEEMFFESFKKQYPDSFLTRRGCPDFFIEHKDNLFFVEVKGRGDKLSKYQLKYKIMLEKLGIRVFISKNGTIPKEIENIYGETKP